MGELKTKYRRGSLAYRGFSVTGNNGIILVLYKSLSKAGADVSSRGTANEGEVLHTRT
jgi:hypothetical protein